MPPARYFIASVFITRRMLQALFPAIIYREAEEKLFRALWSTFDFFRPAHIKHFAADGR